MATTFVMVRNNFFDPASILVSPGATVTWTWIEGANPHNVIFSSGGILPSATQQSGNFQAVMPVAPGTYSYICTIHAGMAGSVTVQ